MGSLPAERRFKVDSVCIIGAGPSGLAAAKYFLAERAFSRIQLYEQRSTVGGIWNYVPHKSASPHDVDIPQSKPYGGANKPVWQQSGAAKIFDKDTKEEAVYMTPLYDRLETNIPRGLMGFSDLDWPEDCQLFPRHGAVLEYIERYADDIRHLIQFRTQVMDVSLTEDEKWTVKTQDVSHRDGEVKTETFDAVIVGNGHFNIPYMPQVRGIEEWSKAYPGSITHSKFYRTPEQYAGKKVIVVGNSASGIDIGHQIEQSCKSPLLLSSKSESFLVNAASSTKVDKPPIAEYVIEDRSVRFEDGTTETDVDAVLYCTGYFYSFPFLSTLDPPVITTGEKVENLYQHIFYQPHPTLAFPVLNQKIIPFPMAEAQGAVVARVFSGRLGLPYVDEMKAWERDWVKQNGDGRMFHVLKFPMDADYINMLHDWSMSADGEGSERGKTPPYWGEKEYWMRERFPAIKKAFQDLGEDRHVARSLRDVGFDYDSSKRSDSE
ncbi:monooxygenase [Elasticomyces elasticus]|nr:monooxygenase [Elasticomyces elasticus]KAK3655122.1 monooxygenase [Elasticomyces elasticus]KAK4907707.1 monooxygenase [Elasticomyces elasticus]KAK5750571.1 monooxygenase [Elasticomyces elasticus]